MMWKEVPNFSQDVRGIILIDGDMIHIGEPNSCFAQTKRNRLRWKARPVFHATEPFFLSGGDQIAIAKQRRRGIGMKCIEAKNDQSRPFPISFLICSRPLP